MPADLNDYFKKRNGGGNSDSNQNSGGGGNNFNIKLPQFDNKKAVPFYIIIAIILLLIVARPFRIINSGEVGIRVTTGVYSPTPLDPGLHFFVPLIQDIIVVDAKVRMMSYTSTEQMGRIGEMQQKLISSGDNYISASSVISQESISVKDARGLDFHIDLAVLYHLNRLQAPNTMSIWGLNWENKIIDPTVREVVREVAGRYNAEDIPQKRSEFAEAIKEDIIKSIDAQEGRPVVLNTVQLREIILPEKIRQQIEQVQIARQEAEVTRNQVARAKQEAEKQVALAKGEADAMKARAQGKADAIKIEADANSHANDVIAKSLTSQLLQLRQIETQAKFNEALKENKDAQIFLTPGGAVPNIWVDTKDKQRQSSIGQ
ncbi:MAG: prohibitin family protein [Campylobacteraceae bacterium]|jgi:regulator of protease activity HflC (stomatin/prohibitin superfamily)|nr:prohibitin family protein [Campylobacteraceae bacterium]